MRGLLVAAGVCAALVLALAGPACADTFTDTWLRGASSVAVNDDATALFVNPAGLGLYQGSNSYTAVSLSGEDVTNVALASKMGPLGVGYTRQYMWEAEGVTRDGGLRPGDDAVDTYFVGLAMGDPRSFSIGFDYRWFRPQFGSEKKTGTWDVGAIYRPTRYLSVGAAVRNLSEPDVLDEDMSRDGEGEGCLRTTYVAGLAVRPLNSKLTLMADASIERDSDLEDAVYTAGVEAEVSDGIVLRGSLQSYPDGHDRESEFSAGLWLNFRYVGVGGAYRSFEAAENDILTFGITSSDERQRTVFRGGGQVAEIDVQGPLSDFRSGWSLFGEPGNSAQSVISDIRKAGRDESVDCILLNIKSLGRPFLGGPSALVQEIRDEVVRVREEHGVKVLAFLEYGAATPEYFLATACDEIMIHPSTGIEGLGTYVTVNRFTGTTEKIGVEWDYISAGEYKSTFHALGGPPLTDEQRAKVQELEDDIYEELLGAVMEGRGMGRSAAEQVCDGRIFIPEKSMELGLIDGIGTYDDAKAAALALAGGDVPEDEEDFEDIGTVDVGSWRFRDYDWGKQPVIAVVGAYGSIGEGEGGTDPLRGRQSIGSESLVRALRAARKNPDVDAVILRVDSGGGSGLASDIIWYETVKVAKEKPFIVSMGDLAGSGGYYIAIEGERIFVEPLTITGSIGVVGMMPVFANLYEKIDATHETFKRGEHADQFSPMRKLTDEEMAMAEEVIEWFYNDFIEMTAKARDMDPERLRELAGGRVYTGNQAIANGLVDERGGLSAAIDYACERVGTTREDARVVYYREGHSFMDQIMSGAMAKLGLWKLFDIDSGMQSLYRMEAFTDLTLD
jgi:protease-4